MHIRAVFFKHICNLAECPWTMRMHLVWMRLIRQLFSLYSHETSLCSTFPTSCPLFPRVSLCLFLSLSGTNSVNILIWAAAQKTVENWEQMLYSPPPPLMIAGPCVFNRLPVSVKMLFTHTPTQTKENNVGRWRELFYGKASRCALSGFSCVLLADCWFWLGCN